MAYTAEQLRNIRLAQKVGSKVGASPVEQKAAVEAMLVESGARNLGYGDRDSVGILQQRPSAGWHNASNPARALADFYGHARQLRGQGLKSGALAQAVQRSAFPDRYAQRAGEAAALIGGSGAPAAASTGSLGQTATTTTSGNPNYAQDRQSLLLSYLTVRDQPDALLNLATGLQGIGSPPKRTTTYSSMGTPGAAAGRVVPTGGYPLAKRGKIIGVPYQGTHLDFGNWQSDNAIDIAAKKGTPVVAVANGRIGSRIGALSSSNPQLLGQRVYVEGKGNQWYYAHLSRIVVKPGQQVRKGQVIGYSGVANGVEHLHIASERGNPLKQFGS